MSRRKRSALERRINNMETAMKCSHGVQAVNLTVPMEGVYTTTDAAGRFGFFNLSEGDYEIALRSPACWKMPAWLPPPASRRPWSFSMKSSCPIPSQPEMYSFKAKARRCRPPRHRAEPDVHLRHGRQSCQSRQAPHQSCCQVGCSLTANEPSSARNDPEMQARNVVDLCGARGAHRGGRGC